MNRILLLLIVLGGLLGLALWKRDTNNKRSNSAKLIGAAMRELLLPTLKEKANDIRKVRIVDGDKAVNLALTGEIWTVGERDNFPAAFDKIAKLVSELAEQKVSKKTEAGKTALGDLQLELPSGKEANPKAGVHIDFLDEKGSSIMGLVLGKNRESTTVGKEASPFGGGNTERVVRLVDGSDGDTAWWVNNQFYELSAKPEDWTNKSFLDVKEIRSVAVTAPTAADSWTVSRKDTSGEFAFEGAAPGEVFDTAKTPLASLLSNATFTDVLTKDKAKPDLMKDASKVKITTFEGFTYNLLVTKKGEGSDLKHYISVAVSADFPKARTPEKDEKEEDKKKKDEEFATKKKDLEERLAKQKATEGWVYDISAYTVETLLKKKSELIKTAPDPKSNPDGSTTTKGSVTPIMPAPAPGAPPAAPSAPQKPISVTTPPVTVPPLPQAPKTEIKPTPSPDANPATGKPNPPAAAPAPAPAKPATVPAPESKPAAAPAAPAK